MLPESTFPVTGGIMQTEEVVPRAQSTGIDGSLTDSTTFQNQIHRSPLLQCSLPSPVLMAVKQEPQEDDERARDTNTLSQQAEADAAPVPVEAGHLGHHHHGHETGHQHHQVQGTEAITGPASHENTGRARSSRGRRKSRWKLKFHHQALPPEYLDHYEASLAQEALNASPTHQGRDSSAASPAPTASTSTSASTPSPVADVQGWLQRIAAMQQELYPRVVSSNPPIDASSLPSAYRRSVITSTGPSYPAQQSQHQQQHNSHAGNNASQHSQQQPAPRPPMKYSDLPYMGEITLDNSKPRRGRKPKKADICHLIYKNYGTILPGTPGHEERKQQSPRERLEIAREQVHHRVPFQRTDIQNRISSLLEKRLTQESRRSLAIADGAREQDEPLNLCIRDLNQLKIRLHRKHGNVYESGQIKSETSSEADEIECLGTNFNVVEGPRVGDLVVANNNDTAVTNSNGVNYNNGSSIDNHNNNINNIISINNNNNNNNTTTNNNNDPSTNPNNPGFVYWPNAGVFIHPMALQSQFLYYQKMAENERVSAKLDNQPKEQKIVPKSLYTMLETKSPTGVQPVPAVQQQAPIQQPASPRPKRNAPIGHQGQQPTKRKRSAIFIPPMPTENNNNPATEVSICKFKFTGGAKPTLQEKKSLSVDAGGNFRYYSGTGDKNMRGYEFFPRETLQQPAGQAGSSAGAFLSAAGERIPPPVPSQRLPVIPDPEGRRKRKTRKSLQREKLEQTFKEKGFLIQTQQLESAEGATYCKFRQLRKFTRYLFRSWKDYLPGNVRDLSGNGDGEIVDGEIDPDHGIIDASSPVTIPGILDVTNGGLEEHRTLPLT